MLVIYRKVPQMGETLLSWEWSQYLLVRRTNRLEVVTSMPDKVTLPLLEVRTLMQGV